LILALCEDAARTEGFTCVELMATMAGEPLYRACGYDAIEEVVDERGGVGVPLLRMKKLLRMIGKLGSPPTYRLGDDRGLGKMSGSHFINAWPRPAHRFFFKKNRQCPGG